MAKSFTASAKQLQPDPRFQSLLASKFINSMMFDGKKSVAMNVFYDAMEIIEKKVTDAPQIEVFTRAIENVKPNIEVRSRRVGGANYQVPTPVNNKRQVSLAIRWILEAARGRKGRGMAVSLADEFIAAFKKEGASINKRENVHKMAEANRAFAHFAWGRN